MAACDCKQTIVDHFTAEGIDAHVTDLPPIVPTPYEPLNLCCPHGVLWFAEPTGDQRAKWASEGTP